MRRRSKTVAASATILIAAIIAALLLLATLQTALTSESTRREQNPVYVGGQPTVQAGLNKSATVNTLTFRVTRVMDSNEPEARHVWDTYSNEYAPLNPISGSTYVIINATVANALNRTLPFSYSGVVLVGNDGRSYYANFAEGTANCNATIESGELKAGDSCTVYIAFSVPDDVAPAKIVYTASKPAIVVNLA